MDILGLIISVIILVYSSILHEIAHGYVAYRLGDPTAKLLGRFSLNPRSHIDPWMSIAMPILTFISSGIMFGGAKPVPVDVFNLRDGIKDLAIVSLVGPLTNAALAITASLLIHLLYAGLSFGQVETSGFLGFILTQVVRWNLVLAIFNLIPIPPLDGSKVIAAILPQKEAAAYLSMGSIGFIILMFLLFFPIGGFSLLGVVSGLIKFSLSILGF
jgi:Zn-dependent protease